MADFWTLESSRPIKVSLEEFANKMGLFLCYKVSPNNSYQVVADLVDHQSVGEANVFMHSQRGLKQAQEYAFTKLREKSERIRNLNQKPGRSFLHRMRGRKDRVSPAKNARKSGRGLTKKQSLTDSFLPLTFEEFCDLNPPFEFEATIQVYPYIPIGSSLFVLEQGNLFIGHGLSIREVEVNESEVISRWSDFHSGASEVCYDVVYTIEDEKVTLDKHHPEHPSLLPVSDQRKLVFTEKSEALKIREQILESATHA